MNEDDTESSEITRTNFVRRIYLDMTGVPPSDMTLGAARVAAVTLDPSFHRIGHAVWAIILGCFGGILAGFFHNRGREDDR